MKIAAVQMVSGPSLQPNLQAAAALVSEAAAAGARLVALPEYFCLMGQRDTDKLAVAEPLGRGPIQQALAETARAHGVWLVGGTLPVAVDGRRDRVRNTCLVFSPQGQQVETVNTVVAPGKSVTAPAPASQEKSEPDQQSIDRKVKQQVAEQEAERKRYCETMRTNLAQLQNNPRVRVEENGETRRITEEERQARITETRDKIAENCN